MRPRRLDMAQQHQAVQIARASLQLLLYDGPGLGFMVWGLGLMVWGLGLRVDGLKFRV